MFKYLSNCINRGVPYWLQECQHPDDCLEPEVPFLQHVSSATRPFPVTWQNMISWQWWLWHLDNSLITTWIMSLSWEVSSCYFEVQSQSEYLRCKINVGFFIPTVKLRCWDVMSLCVQFEKQLESTKHKWGRERYLGIREIYLRGKKLNFQTACARMSRPSILALQSDRKPPTLYYYVWYSNGRHLFRCWIVWILNEIWIFNTLLRYWNDEIIQILVWCSDDCWISKQKLQ